MRQIQSCSYDWHVLIPKESFSFFDRSNLIRSTKLYPVDFSQLDMLGLDNELETYIREVRFDCDFLNWKDICNICDLCLHF